MRTFQVGAPLHHEITPSLQWIEVASTLQIPSFHIVGLPGPEVNEARERVRAAILASGFEFPKRRLILNLSPAHIRKQGTGIDLAMALAVLSQSHSTEKKSTDHTLVAWGELGLDGSVKPLGQMTRALYAAWKAGASYFIFARNAWNEALQGLHLIQGCQEFQSKPPVFLPVQHLKEAWELLQRNPISLETIPPLKTYPQHPQFRQPVSLLPLAPSLQRMIAIAACGSHHVLILGPKGIGKSHAMEWLLALQPPMSSTLRLIRMLTAELGLTPYAPVRRVGAQVRPPALIGSATRSGIRPGEFSLAHGGVLVADEILEWARDSREALREPMERSRITLTRAHGSVELPAQFVLAASGNPCPCGGWPLTTCRCSPRAAQNYLGKLSGPVLDRIDLVILLQHPAKDLASPADPSCLQQLQERVEATAQHARKTWGYLPGLIPPEELEKMISVHSSWRSESALLQAATLRSRHKILRIALTLAAWEGMMVPKTSHFQEASFYRPERLMAF